MSTERHYKSNLRDLFFNLFEFLDVGNETLGKGPYTAMDEQTARDALRALEVLATQELALSFVPSDRMPLTLDSDGNVTLPGPLTDAMKAYYRDGWEQFELPESMGGFGAPPSLIWSAFELLSGAAPCLAFYLFGSFIAKTIDSLGTESQRARYVRPMLDGHWGGAMVLTEPDAGSDVGAGRSRAKHIEGDVWELEGVKCFITNGDYDFADNIVHLVLARPEGAGAGTKGLSMFVVPKFWVNEDGSIGERNGAFVTKVEKKMGLKGSCTCELTLGDRMPCRGLLVGESHNGIRQMFHVIEHARMAVGMKSMSTVSTAYLNALEYAKERVQGPDLAKARQKDAPRVRIIEHPDVRRMLMRLKAHAEGMRALVMYTAHTQDKVELAGGHANPEARSLHRLNDLLLPLVKGFNSDRGYELLGVALQCFGGAGYIQDFPVEQYVRDQKIDSLYEGTTHIQSLDLFFRKIARDQGATLRGLLGQVGATIAELEASGQLTVEAAALKRGLGDVSGMFMTMMSKLSESIYHVGLHGNRMLIALAELVIGWLLVRHATLATAALEGSVGSERAFYEGKLASARYWCSEVLPSLTLARKLVENGTLDLMEVSEDAF